MCSLFLTGSHSLEPLRPWNEYRFWPQFLNIFIPIFKTFHETIVEQAQRTPTFFLTYEQLISDQEQTLKALFAFLLDVESVEGTLVADKIEEVAGKGHK